MNHEEILKINESHKLVQTDTKWEQRKGWDTDTYWYDEMDEDDKLVAKHIVKEETCIYPPFNRNITHQSRKIEE